MDEEPWVLAWHDSQTMSFSVTNINDDDCMYLVDLDSRFATELEAWESAEQTILWNRDNVNAALKIARTGKHDNEFHGAAFPIL